MVTKYARSVKPSVMANLRHAWKIDDTHYRVFGRDSDGYVVFVVVENKAVKVIACPCEARKICFHETVVFKRLLREKLIV